MGEGHHWNYLIIVVSRLGLEPRALALKGRGTGGSQPPVVHVLW